MQKIIIIIIEDMLTIKWETSRENAMLSCKYPLRLTEIVPLKHVRAWLEA